ncbi:SHOCT domain-containing protein [Myroides marinus]|uniref:SHOCT domain-containing protein n=1 Tax=Myroides marinus TaxID=703342 RepID=UPI00257630A7|nr:SHOCT domain-containing protein [Myroides marinus]MDM1534225.1 SHOCT domain-containing protein [Myroides marinus]MDM1541189.1 SHOCT domain-containing protein [Myroides marinus]
MRKITILFMFLFSCLISAQENNFDGKTLQLKDGGLITKGADLQLGKGTKDNGYFKYIEVNANSMMRAYNTNGTNWGVQEANSLSSAYNDLKGKVIRIEERGSKKTGKKFYAIIGVGETKRYQVDIENALLVGEIKVEGNTLFESFNKEPELIKTTSKTDELLKLKSLLDDGLINQEEFNQMKQDILKK